MQPALQTTAGSDVKSYPRPRPNRTRLDVQALRAVAVALVIADHANVPHLRGGYVGVDVFFVISGFIITALLLRESHRPGGISLLGFYARRARRILPAGSVILVFTVLASYHYLGYIQGASVASDARWASLFASNVHFAHDGTQYLGAQALPSPMQHFWSLAVEEQFYLVWPALLILATLILRRRLSTRVVGTLLAVIVAASFTWSVVETSTNATQAYFSPFTRACELATGAAIAVFAVRLSRLPAWSCLALSMIGLAAIALASTTFTQGTAFPGYAVALPVLGAAGVIAGGCVRPVGLVERIARFRPLRWLGDVSYSLYLWHWPLLTIAAERSATALSASARLMLIAAAVVLSAATYYVVEQPFRRSAVLTRRPVVAISFGLVLIFGCVALSTAEIAYHPLVATNTGPPVH